MKNPKISATRTSQIAILITAAALMLLIAVIQFYDVRREMEKSLERHAEISIPQDGNDYAIAFSEGQGEMPLNFKATENGEYTITVNPEGVNLAYLHLIDNMTGADVDLLQTQGYTFDAKTDDYASRFKLVFSANNFDITENGDFAFISNGELIINGTGTLQVFDALGRMLISKDLSALNNHLSTLTFNPGLYILHLINGDNIKTQKIIIL